MSKITFRSTDIEVILYDALLEVELRYNKRTNELLFEVGGDVTYKTRKNKIAITKWLVKAWEYFLMRYPQVYIVCHPWDEDEKFDYRCTAYKKLGFVQVAPCTMVWGNLIGFFTLNEEGKEIRSQYDEMAMYMDEEELENYTYGASNILP